MLFTLSFLWKLCKLNATSHDGLLEVFIKSVWSWNGVQLNWTPNISDLVQGNKIFLILLHLYENKKYYINIHVRKWIQNIHTCYSYSPVEIQFLLLWRRYVDLHIQPLAPVKNDLHYTIIRILSFNINIWPNLYGYTKDINLNTFWCFNEIS